ncbi:MAG: anti-sigma factor family protein [Candidatus Kapaibacteriota bacterium]
MGIDKFINDYIDGELTPEDDKEFRKLLEEDASAQEELDLTLKLISALREDAQSIVVPKSLAERVEQKALATYLKVVPPYTSAKSRRASVALAMLLLLFLLSIYTINDGRITSGNSFFVAQVFKQQDLLQKQIPTNTEEDFELVGK